MVQEEILGVMEEMAEVVAVSSIVTFSKKE